MSSTPCNTGRIGDKIKYEKSKKDFLRLAEHKLSTSRKYQLAYQLHTKERIEQIIAQKLECPALHANYEVINRDGKNILLTKRKNRVVSLQVLSWEEMFDLFMPLHIRSGHCGGAILQRQIRLHSMNLGIEYSYPVICLTFLRRACYLCDMYRYSHSDRYSLLKTPKIGVVHVIAMAPTRCDEKFRYLLIYSDQETHYIILRPLTAKTSLEISAELYKIFTQFGPPMRLHVHGYNSTLTDKIASNLNEICPEFKIETEHQPPRYDLPAVVTERIQDWMTKSKSLVWEVGCYIVQAEMNNDPRMRPSTIQNQPRSTPYTLYFHTDPAPKTVDVSTRATNQNPAPKETQTIDPVTKENQVAKQNQIKLTQMMNLKTNSQNQVTDKNQVDNQNQAEIKLESNAEIQDVESDGSDVESLNLFTHVIKRK